MINSLSGQNIIISNPKQNNDYFLSEKTDSNYTNNKKPAFYKKKLKNRLGNKENSDDTLKSKIAFQKDSLKAKKIKFPASGNIKAGYNYGIVPFAANINYPMGYYTIEGTTSLDLLSLPFNASFYYSDLRNISGLNNYFQLSFDRHSYHERLTKKMALKEQDSKTHLGKLYIQRQEAEKKLHYLKSQENPSKYEQAFNGYNTYRNKLSQLDYNTEAINTSDFIKTPAVKVPDNSNPADSLKNSLQQRQVFQDSLELYSSYIQKANDVRQQIKRYENSISEYNEEIKKTNEAIHAIQHPDQALGKYNPYGDKTTAWLASVRRLDIGLCYPDHSTFLISGATVKGINLELEKSGYYFAFTHGKTINNLLYTNNQVQNALNNMRNLYNFFDFNNVSDNRRITAAKFGIGKKEETHLHLGLLHGYGQVSYFDNLQPEKEKNYVGEIDGKWVINSNNILDITYGKSSVQQESQSLNNDETGFAALIGKPERTNAVLLRYSSSITKTRTRLTFTTRWIDPFFKSYGVGFMRSDNFRYEAKAEQYIGSRFKLSGFYRKDEDNLLRINYFKTTLRTIGTNLMVKVTRRLNVRLGYNPVLQEIKSHDNSIDLKNKNSISHVLVSYTPRLKHVQSSFNALYNYYNLSSEGITRIYRNVNFSNVTQFKIPLQNSISASWFSSDGADSLNNTMLLVNELSYPLKKGAYITGGGKYAANDYIKNQFGYSLKAGAPLINNLSAEAGFEKLVLGDFYNSYNILQIKKFPYFCSLHLIFSW